MSALLKIRDLTVRRDKRTVLEIKALAVEKGEVLAIVGPNGTGKSSLLLTLARLLQLEKGELLWDGLPFTEQTDLAYRRRIALVLQEPLLLDTSVFENIAIGLRYRGIPSAEVKDKVNRWLARVGIESLRSRPGAKLSGGEAQRVSLARAFVLNPELLLLDEPFSALDAPTRMRLLDDLKSILAETGTTTILITHDLKEAAQLASRVAVMLDGHIVQIGAPQEVFDSPASPDVAAFLGI
jgi:tungstate transport system ATP-binding protein